VEREGNGLKVRTAAEFKGQGSANLRLGCGTPTPIVIMTENVRIAEGGQPCIFMAART
jgi:hypothetical protein